MRRARSSTPCAKIRSNAERILALLVRISVSGHVEGDPIEDDDTPGLRVLTELGDHDTLSVLYVVLGQTVTIYSIGRFPLTD